jgi:hypothetical protein
LGISDWSHPSSGFRAKVVRVEGIQGGIFVGLSLSYDHQSISERKKQIFYPFVVLYKIIKSPQHPGRFVAFIFGRHFAIPQNVVSE